MSDKNDNVDISKVLAPLSLEQIRSLKKEDLALLYFHEQKIRLQLQTFLNEAKAANVELQDKRLLLEEQYVLMKNQLFGKSSERSEITPRPQPKGPKKNKKRKKKCQKPSERYPNLSRIKRDLELETPPKCSLCETQMTDSGMSEESEYLTVIPMEFVVIDQHRHKYRCSKCHGDVKTTPAPPRICPGSSYSDEMILDVSLSKYCDLIPIERYVAMAARRGVQGLPPQSLIELTHHLADFVRPVFQRIYDGILKSRVLHADETPHRMLEGGGDTSSWYLWSFSNKKSTYFEIHDTRSGDVASDLLIKSCCERLVTDVYSGYGKAVKVANKQRLSDQKPLIQNCYCNAHARRKFSDAESNYPEAENFIALYRKIYRLEEIAQRRPSHRILRVRKYMEPMFEKMRNLAISIKNTVSSKSLLATAVNYLTENFEGLTLFLDDPEIPIDNNFQERRLRNPVIGRKTWYGTHSRRGAETNAILFTLIESCKLCEVNPRQYFRQLIDDIHAKKPPLTPSEFVKTPTG